MGLRVEERVIMTVMMFMLRLIKMKICDCEEGMREGDNDDDDVYDARLKFLIALEYLCFSKIYIL